MFRRNWTFLSGLFQSVAGGPTNESSRLLQQKDIKRTKQQPWRLIRREEDGRTGGRLRLENLPWGLVHQIIDFLPTSSAAAMILCSRNLYFVIGTHHLETLRNNKLELATFLDLLERDLPNYTFCNSCVKLHDGT